VGTVPNLFLQFQAQRQAYLELVMDLLREYLDQAFHLEKDLAEERHQR
jgi:hypothetical protein